MPRTRFIRPLGVDSTSPGLSLVPAKRLPIITVSAPAAKALAMSPAVRTPPSAMIGTPTSASTTSTTAVSCGTPTPATKRVVQTPPGPTPTLMASAPASTRSMAPWAVATLPAMISTSGWSALSSLMAAMAWSEWP